MHICTKKCDITYQMDSALIWKKIGNSKTSLVIKLQNCMHVNLIALFDFHYSAFHNNRDASHSYKNHVNTYWCKRKLEIVDIMQQTHSRAREQSS